MSNVALYHNLTEDISFNLDYYRFIDSMIIIDIHDYRYRVIDGSLIHNITISIKQK